ncbi:hypothetical protein [Xanthobacter autotrophicus]|uniref:hypothetical protein n=1 Tax=Xanthobacter autotrophicus TaxID=280 RepID=UPI00372A9350
MAPLKLEVPFQPLRNTLYSSLELMDAFDPISPDSMADTLDFKSYRYFISNGAAATTDPYAGMMEALHDNSILRSMTVFLQQVARPAVAIMGGHGERRDTSNYANVVEIARRLTKAGYLVSSGGGPGAMEATHLGALLANAADREVGDALTLLKASPHLPESKNVVDKEGMVDMQIVRALHAWAKPAFELGKRYIDSGAESLAVPTWYYGHEPISPLASHVAKYFQNSIREDVLLSMAANGIIYTAGAAGTLQEVFQDAAQNYYPKPGEAFAPMVFFGEKFWTQKLPVMPVLEALFVGNNKLTAQEFKDLVVVVDTVDDAVAKLLVHNPTEQKTANRMKALGFGQMMKAAELNI